MKPIPDSEIARQAEKLLRGTSESFLVNHSLRSYLWGAARQDHLDPIGGALVSDKITLKLEIAVTTDAYE